jgi:hypothetical protein
VTKAVYPHLFDSGTWCSLPPADFGMNAIPCRSSNHTFHDNKPVLADSFTNVFVLSILNLIHPLEVVKVNDTKHIAGISISDISWGETSF